jgi:methyl-accepting chemotaxis protein
MSTTPPTASSGQTTGSYKRSARNYLLDSHFQLKYSGFLVAVALVISGVLGTVVWSTTTTMVAESQKLIEESKKVSEVSRMNIKDLASDSPDLLAEFNKEADEHDQMIANQQARLIHRQEVLIESVVGGLTLMVVLIGLLGIYVTHKVAGPVYKMKRLLGQVGQGNLRVDARLRKGDELRDFFEAFQKMVANLRTLEKQQLDYVDKAIDAVERGAKEDAKTSLGKVRDAMRNALEG